MKISLKSITLASLLCAGLAVCAPTFTTPALAAPEIYWDASLVVGSKPPALTEKTLEGKPLSLDSYKGKVVLLDFWATWCPPCRAAIPNLKAQYQKYHAKGFEVVGISLDSGELELRKYIKDNAMPWPQLFEAKHPDAKTYGVQGIPFTLLIGKDGKIAAVNPDGTELETAIKAALAKK